MIEQILVQKYGEKARQDKMVYEAYWPIVEDYIKNPASVIDPEKAQFAFEQVNKVLPPDQKKGLQQAIYDVRAKTVLEQNRPQQLINPPVPQAAAQMVQPPAWKQQDQSQSPLFTNQFSGIAAGGAVPPALPPVQITPPMPAPPNGGAPADAMLPQQLVAASQAGGSGFGAPTVPLPFSVPPSGERFLRPADPMLPYNREAPLRAAKAAEARRLTSEQIEFWKQKFPNIPEANILEVVSKMNLSGQGAAERPMLHTITLKSGETKPAWSKGMDWIGVDGQLIPGDQIAQVGAQGVSESSLVKIELTTGEIVSGFRKGTEFFDLFNNKIDPANIKVVGPREAAALSTTPEDLDEVANAIADGQMNPILSNYSFRDRTAIGARLSRLGYNQVGAERDYKAITRHLQSLNSTQQLRLRQAISFVDEHLPIIDDLYKQWHTKARATGFRVINRALLQSKQVPGEMGALAQALQTQINDFTSEMGQVYRGGYAPTDDALKLASQNLQSDWNEETWNKNMNLLKTTLQLRRNSIYTSEAMGVAPTSPYQPPMPPRGSTPSGTRLPAPPPVQDLRKKYGY